MPNDATTVTAPPPDQQPTQSAPIAGQLSPPAAPAPQQQAPPPQAVPAKPGETFHNLSHSFLGAVLGTLAGAPPTKYTTDNDPASATYGRQAVDPKQPTDSVSDRLKRIASNALMGLAAGSQVDPKKSGAADVLAGVGAGFEGVTQQKLQQDATSREKETENFKQQQAAKLQQMEIAKGNALTKSTYYANIAQQNDLIPQYKENESLFNAAKNSPEFGGRVTEMNWDQIQKEMKDDPTFSVNHIVRPLGTAISTDETGQPINVGDQPQTYMRFAVIDGTKGGKIEVSPELAKSIAEYGPLAGIPNAADIKAGHEYTIEQIVPLLNRVDEQRKNVLEGWANSKVGVVKDATGKEVPIEINNYDKQRQRPYGVITPELMKAFEEQGLNKAEIDDKEADAAEKRADAKNLAMYGINLPANYTPSPSLAGLNESQLRTQLTGQGVPLPPNFSDLYAIAHYKTDPNNLTQNPRKGVPGMSRDAGVSWIRNFANPNYDQKVYPEVANMEKEFADTKPSSAGGNLVAFNTATAHLGQLYDAAQAMSTSSLPALNKIALEMGIQTGHSAPLVFNNIRTALVGELGKTFKGSSVTDQEVEEIKNGINAAQSPQQIADVIKTNAHLMLSKARALTSHYYGYTGEYPPQVIDPAAAAVYQKLGIDTGDITQNQNQGQPAAFNQNPQSGQAPNLTNLGVSTDGKTTIGWDGKQWVDSKTGQPYAPPAGGK